MSPQQYSGEKPTFADDVYALGALLYALSTCTEPATAPNPGDLLARPPKLLNHSLDQAWIQGIVRCLAPKPEQRYRSIREVETVWLEEIPDQTESVSILRQDESVSRWIEREQWAKDSASRLAETLCRAASKSPGGKGVAWTSRENTGAGHQCRDLAIGNAGAVLALAKLSALGQQSHKEMLESATISLAAAPRFLGTPLAGLYIGEAGVGMAFLRSGQVLCQSRWVEAAHEVGEFVSTLPFASPDLYHGTAGRARFHLELWRVTGDEVQLRAALAAGDELLNSAEHSTQGAYWTIPAGYGGLSGRNFLGYAHGAAGIADVLLDLFDTTSQDKYREAAVAAREWIFHWSSESSTSSSTVGWPSVPEERLFPPFWCHGATGIGKFLLHAACIDLHPHSMELALKAARASAENARWAGPTLCHGLAGNIELLLEVGRATGDRKWYEQAWELATLLRAFATETDQGLSWPSDIATVFTPDYMVGYSGIGVCLMHLAGVASPFSDSV
jgi:hypothetical protein